MLRIVAFIFFALTGIALGQTLQGIVLNSSNTGVVQNPTAWTPTDESGASLVFTIDGTNACNTSTHVCANWVQTGNIVFAYAQFFYPSTANGSNSQINLPVTVANHTFAQQCSVTYSAVSAIRLFPTANSQTASFLSGTGSAVVNSTLSTTQVNIMCIYPVS